MGLNNFKFLPTSPSIASFTITTLLIFFGNMSNWKIPPRFSFDAFLASGANFSKFPVTLSSNLAPRAMMISAFCIAKFAYADPCIPSMCNDNSFNSSITPIPIKVVVTGICAFSESSLTSSTPSLEFKTP
eukprot:NODE_323_length_9725_cov_0.840536.p11 type:complete len:130 gc:universal NODE_323_length_9725_cov_0.840536:3464-3075(-)